MQTKNLNILTKLGELEELEISSINEYCNLDALSSCVKLRKLSLYFDSNSQQTGFDFKLLSKCISLETLNINGLNDINICGKITDINQLNGLNNLKELSISGDSGWKSKSIKIAGPDNKVFL